jgi:tartrate-resistant acid phosphatase type 5
MRIWMLIVIVPLLAVELCGCQSFDLIDPAGISVNTDADSAIFAVIGDYGKAGNNEKAVRDLVKGWHPDFIITAGDNNYEKGDYSTLMENIGDYYGDYIYNFDAPEKYRLQGRAFQEKLNRFFPSPGNHDGAGSQGLEPYLNYFTLPGLEEYYTFSWGEAAFYSINSLSSANHEEQKSWLENEIKHSLKKFQIVYFHYPPYSPGIHGDTDYMQWDFQQWGVDVVISGHDHIYARLEKPGEKGLQYIINGLGGKSKYRCNGEDLDPEVSLLACYNENYGAMKCAVYPDRLIMEFYSTANSDLPIDRLEIVK